MEYLSYTFIQKALLGGLAVSFTTSILGVFVVQRGLSFLGSGLAHAAFGGVALGLLLNFEPLWIAIPFTLIVALSMSWVHNKSKLGNDATIGVLFAIAVALGVVFLSLKKSYVADIYGYLFGSILTIKNTDLILSGLVVIILLAFLPLWGRFAYTTFDHELAMADHIPVKKDDYLLMFLISISIVIGVKILGTVLIASYLVIPAASARLVTNRLMSMTLVSVIIGLLSTIIGLFTSFIWDIPSGATIILTQGLIFFSFLIFKK
ncbi:MAG: manganese transporter [Deltaproteobacteria bacterium RIFCSPLOWO2_12_FULL_40_28]|nr:MAG: manganese transporter [Deltaproteobacteria bacterium RIFCSPHIGHO2_02_FULL_40_28]OGQ19229.1 MAG: manganese transporter [Deltaproteobacteria bacterium RIFCSPHIGHO2_12_FULL_40_32]OGQ40547.1 MAG: manganese transporter [Deltaproteobacteria bacterium RIFCSPLOWO2_02_FULL_40_36]OGQ53782.1 MAG: manganese transporter [Deltaproteobacteria bacterium RIFCSPLOWO2_12_FULL_40_28]